MTTGRYSRRNVSFRHSAARRSDRENNFFLGIIGLSLFIHVIVAAIFLHNPNPRVQHRPPTLYVDLVMAPVANPQRGSAGSIRKITEPVAVAPSQPSLPTKVVKAPVKEVKKSTTVKDDDIAADIAADIAKKREKLELKKIEDEIANMRRKPTLTPPATAAVGSPTGTGDDAGGEIKKWIYDEFRAKWKLSKYQVKNPNLKVRLTIEYDKNGILINPDFEWSGDKAFDDTIRKAFESFSKKKLPATYLSGMQKNFKDEITLTPKELFEK